MHMQEIGIAHPKSHEAVGELSNFQAGGTKNNPKQHLRLGELTFIHPEVFLLLIIIHKFHRPKTGHRPLRRMNWPSDAISPLSVGPHRSSPLPDLILKFCSTSQYLPIFFYIAFQLRWRHQARDRQHPVIFCK